MAADAPAAFAADPACAGAWADWLKEHDAWTWEGVLAAVLAYPDQDGPRELAAVWFAENGDAVRAEFVRVQLDVASWGVCPGGAAGLHRPPARCPECERRSAVRRRERELLETMIPNTDTEGRAWRTTAVWFWSGAVAVNCRYWSFRRGFVESVTLPAAAWLAHGPALVRAAPLRRVTLAGKDPLRAPCPGFDGYRFQWNTDPRLQSRAHEVPARLHSLLGNPARGYWHSYDTRDNALDALSAAAMAWAKAQPA